MSIKLSQRVQAVKPSPTLAITARAAALRAAGKDVIGLGAGEPDFDTPEHIKEAGIKAIRDGKTKYTPVDGTAELKQAVIDKFRRDNGHEYAMDQILVSCGGKQSFYNLAQAVLDPGDEVVIPAPYWVSYPDMVKLADGLPVILSTGLIWVAWTLPFYAWLLLCSSAARRSPLMLALGIPVGLMILERLFLGSGYLGDAFSNHIPHPGVDGSQPLGCYFYEPQWGSLDYAGLLLGLLVTAAFLGATLWFRKHRFEV